MAILILCLRTADFFPCFKFGYNFVALTTYFNALIPKPVNGCDLKQVYGVLPETNDNG
jgi:hypothetical protein